MAALTKLDKLLIEVRDCGVCEYELPLGPNSIVRAKRSARILIIVVVRLQKRLLTGKNLRLSIFHCCTLHQEILYGLRKIVGLNVKQSLNYANKYVLH
jgi:hypothetical protein